MGDRIMFLNGLHKPDGRIMGFSRISLLSCLVDWRIAVFAGGLAKKNKIDLTLTVEWNCDALHDGFYGFLMILSLMVIFMILFFTIDLYFFPVEMHIMAINAFLPWILGGFTTYFFVAMIAMEPSWKFRCLYAIVVMNYWIFTCWEVICRISMY